MNSEIKDGLFTSTQTATVLGMSVQTLREWQRKNYLALPDTGGWQRYRIADILALSAMDHLLDFGYTHELAAFVAKLSLPVLLDFMEEKDKGTKPPRLLISMKPNSEPVVVKFQTGIELEGLLESQEGDPDKYMINTIVDFIDVIEFVFENISEHVTHDGPTMFWTNDGGQA